MTGPALSNHLVDMAERAGSAWRASRAAAHEAAERAIEAGQILIEAKKEARHGTWLPLLDRAEIPKRQAQRLMQLAKFGLKSDTVTLLGGVAASLMFLTKMPEEGEALLVSAGNEHAVIVPWLKRFLVTRLHTDVERWRWVVQISPKTWVEFRRQSASFSHSPLPGAVVLDRVTPEVSALGYDDDVTPWPVDRGEALHALATVMAGADSLVSYQMIRDLEREGGFPPPSDLDRRLWLAVQDMLARPATLTFACTIAPFHCEMEAAA